MSLRNREGLAYLAVLAMAAVVAFAISRPTTTRESPQNTSTSTPNISEVTPIDLGSGIFYFPATDEAYLKALTKFYKLFPWRRCELQGFTEELSDPDHDSRTARTITSGFILHCREGAVEAQGVTVP